MRRKGFTLIELLVVIAIIALLMSILMPALARVRELAQRVVCGTNLKGIGSAMMVYSNEAESSMFPRNGDRTTVWGEGDPMAGDPAATVSSSLYLLVRGDYCQPKQFICKSDTDAEGMPSGIDPLDEIDFGGNISYAYHMPYRSAEGIGFPLTSASNPGLAVAAYRSPHPGGEAGDNSQSHQGDGQNIMFVDSHVDWEKNPYKGISDDNIYTLADGTLAEAAGFEPTVTDIPLDRDDSMLVNDAAGGGGGIGGG